MNTDSTRRALKWFNGENRQNELSETDQLENIKCKHLEKGTVY